MTKRIRKKRRWPWVLLLLLCALALAVYLSCTWLQVEQVTFQSEQIPAGFDGFRIVQISDLHGSQFGTNNEALLQAVADAQPDLIAITGDMVDRATDWQILEPLLPALVELAPTYFVTGNHEWSISGTRALLDLIESYGVTVLENEYLLLERGGDTIALCGVHDPNGYRDQKKPQALLAEVPDELFTLLLSHRNDYTGAYEGYDLVLAGHAHGGIIRLPFTDGLIDPAMNLFPSYTAGFYTLSQGTSLYISRGLGNTPRATFRLFNRPHLPVLTLKAA